MHFADLHDTPGRMKAKKVIRNQVQWAQSRKYFYWRLRRRLKEFEFAENVFSSCSGPKSGQRQQLLQDLETWFLGVGGSPAVWEDDQAIVCWYDENKDKLQEFLGKKKCALQSQQVKDKLENILSVVKGNALQIKDAQATLREALQGLSSEEKELLAAALK